MAAQLSEALTRGLVFVSGKGGVGKTVVSQALALALARRSRKPVLWVTFEDPTRPAGEMKSGFEPGLPALTHLNCDPAGAFEEYAAMKIGIPALSRVFLRNKLIRYMAKAAPGIHELVLLGKVWFERQKFGHVVVDMPSTGFGLAMFHSTRNFARLFRGGPIHRDADAMLETFGDPGQTGQLIVSLPEEMPLVESLELGGFLEGLFPKNAPAYLVNRIFPGGTGKAEDLSRWRSPLAASVDEYLLRRVALEQHNLRLWRDRGLVFGELGYVPPPPTADTGPIVHGLAQALEGKYL